MNSLLSFFWKLERLHFQMALMAGHSALLQRVLERPKAKSEVALLTDSSPRVVILIKARFEWSICFICYMCCVSQHGRNCKRIFLPLVHTEYIGRKLDPRRVCPSTRRNHSSFSEIFQQERKQELYSIKIVCYTAKEEDAGLVFRCFVGRHNHSMTVLKLCGGSPDVVIHRWMTFEVQWKAQLWRYFAPGNLEQEQLSPRSIECYPFKDQVEILRFRRKIEALLYNRSWTGLTLSSRLGSDDGPRGGGHPPSSQGLRPPKWRTERRQVGDGICGTSYSKGSQGLQ